MAGRIDEVEEVVLPVPRLVVEATACALIVIPRSRSRSIESRNCSAFSRWLSAPVRSRRRSESVVFPWSMWAMIEKLRMLLLLHVGPGGAPGRARQTPYSQSVSGGRSRPCRGGGVPKKRPRPFSSSAPGRVEAEQAVGQHRRAASPTRPRGASRPGRPRGRPPGRSGRRGRTRPVLEVLEEVGHLLAAPEGGREAEERLGVRLDELPQATHSPSDVSSGLSRRTPFGSKRAA